MTIEQQIDRANETVMNILINGRPIWTDVQPAASAIPGMSKNKILVAGPPISIDQIVPPVRTTICGAALHEGLAKNPEEAWAMVESGAIEIGCAQDLGCACGAAMALSASMPVVVCEDKAFGGKGFCSPHPGNRQHVLRWGFYDDEIEADLRWFRDGYGPALGEAVRLAGGVDVISILSRTAGMGDENHNRQPAASMAMALDLIPHLMDITSPHKEKVIKEFAANDRFFLHIMMAAVEAVVSSAKHTPMSTIMVGMGGNGVEFGLQFAGTGGEWFNVPAPKILGQFLNPSYTEDDILGFLGDSCVTEIYGLGGISAVAGPSYVRLTGGSFGEAKRRTDNARQICLGEHLFAPIPWDDFRGFPVGIDMRRVVALGILPTSHGGSTLIAGGQGGAGSADLPMDCFKQGLISFSKLAQEGSVPHHAGVHNG